MAAQAMRRIGDPELEVAPEVGVGVQLEHTGGAVEGDTVTISAKLKSFDGRKADFDVEVRRKGNVIGRIGHQRAAVPLDKLKQRIVAMQQGDA